MHLNAGCNTTQPDRDDNDAAGSGAARDFEKQRTEFDCLTIKPETVRRNRSDTAKRPAGRERRNTISAARRP